MNTLISDFLSPEQGENKFLLFEAIQLAILRYGSRRKLIDFPVQLCSLPCIHIMAAPPLVLCPSSRQAEEKGQGMKDTCQGVLEELYWKPHSATSAPIFQLNTVLLADIKSEFS